MLERLLQAFKEELPSGACFPGSETPDDSWYAELARLLLSPERLPDRLTEALFAIDEMATTEGQERLERGLVEWGLQLELPPRLSRQEFAVHVWLAAPELLTRKHNELRMLRLTRFEYFRSRAAGHGVPFILPGADALAAFPEMLDEWFARHQRGHGTVQVEPYQLEGEHWFVVRHGDAFTRAPSVEGGRREIIHYRPERDDLVVYSPPHDEVRIHARTRGERELYRRRFGTLLRGDEDYFSQRLVYTLEPLRKEGPDALDTEGVEGIRRVRLREYEVTWDNGNDDYRIFGGRNLLGDDGTAPDRAGIPSSGRLTRAVFELDFEGSRQGRPMEICPPNVLKLGRHCDARAVDDFISKRGFKLLAAA